MRRKVRENREGNERKWEEEGRGGKDCACEKQGKGWEREGGKARVIIYE